MNSEDEQILLGGEWLNDKIMNACQELIKSNYPQVLGLQDVACGRTLSYEVQTGEFVQIIHTGRGHWIAISTIGCGSAEVDVFDSMSPVISSSLQNQVASLLCSKSSIITLRYVQLEFGTVIILYIRYKQCQLQKGPNDCGLFAFAFAAVLSSGKHPSAFHFNQLELRQHLHRCLTQGCLLPFPVLRHGRENRKTTRHQYSLHVYCNCRMPKTFSSKMIKCDQC